MSDERQRLLDYLALQGWKQDEAEILVDHGQDTFTYAAVRFSEACYHLGKTTTAAFTEAFRKAPRA